MAEEEIAHLKTEIARLQQIISLLRTQVNVQHQLLSVANIGDTLPQEILSDINFRDGLSEENLSNVKTGDANGGSIISNAKTYNGQSEASISNANIEGGQKQHALSNAKTYGGQTELLKPLPQTLELSQGNMSRIYGILKQSGFNKVSHTGIITTIKLLIHFHNKKGGSHRELRKLTGLSAGGLNKFLISLRKRGLIAKSGWQQFSLTSTGAELKLQPHKYIERN